MKYYKNLSLQMEGKGKYVTKIDWIITYFLGEGGIGGNVAELSGKSGGIQVLHRTATISTKRRKKRKSKVYYGQD
jgi:hypothetical protein